MSDELKVLKEKLARLEGEKQKEKAKRAEYNKRRNAKRELYIKKAQEQGIKVSEAEIDAYIKKNG